MSRPTASLDDTRVASAVGVRHAETTSVESVVLLWRAAILAVPTITLVCHVDSGEDSVICGLVYDVELEEIEIAPSALPHDSSAACAPADVTGPGARASSDRLRTEW